MFEILADSVDRGDVATNRGTFRRVDRVVSIAWIAALGCAGCTLNFAVDSLPCAGGLTACGLACVDTHVDPSNCGSCGNSCSSQSLGCSAGGCQSPTTLTWTTSSSAQPPMTQTTVTAPDAGPNTEEFDYTASGMQVYSPQTFTFSAVAPTTRTFNFQWTYNGFHAYFMAWAALQAFANDAGGNPVTIDLVPHTTTNAGFTFQGTASLQLVAGQSFGFIASGRNFDTDSRLIGTVTITPQ